jgi:hypothetical protein
MTMQQLFANGNSSFKLCTPREFMRKCSNDVPSLSCTQLLPTNPAKKKKEEATVTKKQRGLKQSTVILSPRLTLPISASQTNPICTINSSLNNSTLLSKHYNEEAVKNKRKTMAVA